MHVSPNNYKLIHFPQSLRYVIQFAQTFTHIFNIIYFKVAGKIVVFNQEWTGYGSTVAYRHGSVQASQYGAIASLTKSVADFSLYTPHTGQTVSVILDIYA